MKKIIEWFSPPEVPGPSSIIFIRVMVGGIFLWEGILKFVYTNQGVGRFTKLDFPFPSATADFVAWIEIIGGLLILLGLFTRYTAFVFIIEMIVAMITTKIALYFGTSPLPLPPAPPQVGVWAVLHEIRSDYSLLLCSLFLLFEGPGIKSLDHTLINRSSSSEIPLK